MLNGILGGLAVAIIVFGVVVDRQPDDFRVTRTIAIEAPTADAFARVYDLRQWNDWSPWAKLDPAALHSFDGASEGKGAAMRWDSENREVGKGSMTLMESRPDEFVQFVVELQRPVIAVNTAEFTFQREDDRTVVTWSMFGKRAFLGKAMNLLFSGDKMLGDRFEQGLANLKNLLENPPVKPDIVPTAR